MRHVGAHDTVQGVDCRATNCALLTIICALEQLDNSDSDDDWEYVPSLIADAKM